MIKEDKTQLTPGFNLAGKVAIVTGGNGGIGRGIAIGLAQAGADIIIAARNEEKTAAVVDEIRDLGRQCAGIRCDVGIYEEIRNVVERTVQEFGHLDILVNNAGISDAALPQLMTEEQWDRVMDTNLKGSFQFCQAVYPAFVKAGGGKIINIASQCASSAMVVNYAASKMGLAQVTKSLALAWANDNIQINAIVPGWFRTDLTSPVIENEKFYQSVVRRTPAGRFGEPEELAGVAILLASGMSDFITGECIVVDGGYSLMV